MKKRIRWAIGVQALLSPILSGARIASTSIHLAVRMDSDGVNEMEVDTEVQRCGFALTEKGASEWNYQNIRNLRQGL